MKFGADVFAWAFMTTLAMLCIAGIVTVIAVMISAINKKKNEKKNVS